MRGLDPAVNFALDAALESIPVPGRPDRAIFWRAARRTATKNSPSFKSSFLAACRRVWVRANPLISR